MDYWWRRHPGRLEFEIQQLKENGIPCELDQQALARGVAILNIEANTAELGALKLCVIFPAQYPLLPFEIEAPDLTLHHHQNPFEKNLCTLSNPSEHWKSTMTVLEFVQEQIPRVLEAGLSTEKNELEAPRGEPASNYFASTGDSLVFFDSAWKIPAEISEGTLALGYNESPAPTLFRGAVLEVRDLHNNILVSAAPALQRIYGKKLTGRWVRFADHPASNEPRAILREATNYSGNLAKTKVSLKPGMVDVVGILFPEETEWRGKGDGWMFICREGHSMKPNLILARGGRAGRIDMNGRNPYLAGLADKKVAVFGLGCLGAPSALEFAKCGIGGIRLLDGDTVETGTIVRWPFGLQTAAGKNKVGLLAGIIGNDYPYTNVEVGYSCRIGIANSTYISSIHEDQVLESMFNGADLVFDATASPAVNNVLATLAVERGIPYIFISATPGMWGGRIVRIMPGGRTGCFRCYSDSVMAADIPMPISAGNDGYVEPPGCSAPTFMGTYFDASVIAMGGVRMAVSTLLEGVEGGYPPTPWDVAVIDLRDESGNLIPPTWRTFTLEKRLDCQQCGRTA
jgi:molybdopterin/thiamine biosynthesis adenylyltransferase